MAIQIGTVDGLFNITEQKVRCMVNAIEAFSRGYHQMVRGTGIALGTAFQRFVEPVYSGVKTDFEFSDIHQPVYTKAGNEQSPARITFCRKMGLLKIDESNDVFELTPLAKELFNHNITIEEYAFILLTKQGIFQDSNYKKNLLVHIAEFFTTNTFIKEQDVKDSICNNYNDSNVVKTRLDIIFNALVLCGILSNVGSTGQYVLSDLESADILNDYYTLNNGISAAYLDDSPLYTNYIGSLDKGIFDILNNKNRSIYTKKFPNLNRYIQQNNMNPQSAITPSKVSATLTLQEYSYIAAIKTKPFLILGGFSGTGKSQKVLELAFATCPCDGKLNVLETSPGNYLLVSVKPNWHDATDITGFRSSVNRNYYVTDFMRFLVKAKQYPEVPFFVCLDEMNLAPVEEYFADFLSVIESRKKKADGTIVTEALVPASVFTANDYADDFNIFMNLGLKTVTPNMKPEDYSALSDDDKNSAFERQDIVDELKRDGLTIPQNVVIIGTVNMDDTTNSFSRKVIDRAMTFETVVNEFDDSYFKSDVSLNYIQNNLPGNLFISDEVRATQMLENGDADFTLSDDDKQKILNFINDINRDLEGSPFKVSYRILNETILYYRAKQKIEEIMNARGGFEAGVIFNTDLDTIFDDVLMQKVLPRIEGDYEKCHKCLSALGDRANTQNWNKSKEKIEFMINRFGSDNSGFTNFWN